MKKGDFLLKALETIALAAGGLLVGMATIAVTPYGTPTGRALQDAGDMMEGLFSDDAPLSRRRYRNLRYRLRKDGLVHLKQKKGRPLWELTAKGWAKLRQLQNDPQRLFAALEKASAEPRRKMALLIIFDIPERHRKKRLQLRAALRAMGCVKLQQSAWRCDSAIPEEFLKYLKALELLDYVEILEISKEGTLGEKIDAK